MTQKEALEWSRLEEHEACCNQCMKAAHFEKRKQKYQEIEGISLPTEIPKPRFIFLNELKEIRKNKHILPRQNAVSEMDTVYLEQFDFV